MLVKRALAVCGISVAALWAVLAGGGPTADHAVRPVAVPHEQPGVGASDLLGAAPATDPPLAPQGLDVPPTSAPPAVESPPTTVGPPATRPPDPPNISLQPCGGDLPPCWVAERESGGNYNAVSPPSFCGGRGCFGKWQFSGEWACKLGLPCDLRTATPEQQDNAARILWNGGAGCGNWDACR